MESYSILGPGLLLPYGSLWLGNNFQVRRLSSTGFPLQSFGVSDYLQGCKSLLTMLKSKYLDDEVNGSFKMYLGSSSAILQPSCKSEPPVEVSKHNTCPSRSPNLQISGTRTWYLFVFLMFIFWPHWAACGILVPQPETELTPSTLQVWSQPLDHQRSLCEFSFLVSKVILMIITFLKKNK